MAKYDKNGTEKFKRLKIQNIRYLSIFYLISLKDLYFLIFSPNEAMSPIVF